MAEVFFWGLPDLKEIIVYIFAELIHIFQRLWGRMKAIKNSI